MCLQISRKDKTVGAFFGFPCPLPDLLVLKRVSGLLTQSLELDLAVMMNKRGQNLIDKVISFSLQLSRHENDLVIIGSER